MREGKGLQEKFSVCVEVDVPGFKQIYCVVIYLFFLVSAHWLIQPAEPQKEKPCLH